MRSFWSRVPMLRVMFAMITGIAVGIATAPLFHNTLPVLLIDAGVLMLSLLFVLIIGRSRNSSLAFRLRIYHGLALHASIISFSFLLTWFYTQKNHTSHFANFLADENVLTTVINDPPVIRDKVVMATADVVEVNNMNGHIKTTGIIQLSFLRDSLCEQLRYGDKTLIRAKIDTTEGPKNPYEFDFKAYQSFHNIYQKAFVTRSGWKLIAHNQGSSFLSAVYRLRNSFLLVLSRYVTDKNDFGVASAIMLGYRDYINADIMRAYASSGTVHILSVSGFHVSIMFFMLNFLLSWMDKRGRKMLFAKASLIISFIWFYACLTGLSPPVLRCALMFTFIQLGNVLIRNVNMYNIVASSAVMLMLFNPFVIADVGFQLSYLAVFGLVYMQPKIAGLWVMKKTDALLFKVADFFWQLIAASVAAQIATLPLCLLYFYQFPNLFLLSNMVVIPLSNLLLFSGTLLFAVGHIPLVNDVAGWVFSHVLVLLDRFIFWIDTLPFALTKAISISLAEMILLYLLIVLLCWLMEERKNKVLLAALGLVALLCCISSFKSAELHEHKEIAVYSVSKQKAIAFIADKTLYYDFDSTLINDQSNMQFHVYHHWWKNGVKQELPLNDKAGNSNRLVYSTRIALGQIVLFEGKEILIADSLSMAEYNGTKIRLKPDLVIISGTLKISLPVLKKSVDFDEVVFDSRCRPASRKRWKKDCAELNITYWDVNAQGAFIWGMNKDMP